MTLERAKEIVGDDRKRGALYGMAIGDALAMPVHWYYDRSALRRDYGKVTRFLAPKSPHPGSILWRSSYRALNADGEILHDQAAYWGKKGIHYHQFLEAGENTLNAQLAFLALESMGACGGYDAEDYLQRYLSFMRTPGRHRDTYLEECHRGFFTNLARGRNPRRCAVEEKHIGGLTGILAVVIGLETDVEGAQRVAREHLALTHAGTAMAEAADLVAALLVRMLRGEDLATAIDEMHARQESRYLGFPLGRWLDDPDEEVIGARLSPACYIDESLPGVIYLARKYHDRPEEALIVNTNLGGDNVHRGTVLGALLGAAHGMSAWPDRWVNGLRTPPPVPAP